MKKNKNFALRLFCLFLALSQITGCTISENNGHGTGGATDWQLCNHWWEGNYFLDDIAVNHQIIFYYDQTGHEYLNYQNTYGETWTESYDFRWQWANSLQNSIALSYSGGGLLYMDQVYIDFDLFSCLLDGTFVTFKGQ